MDTVYVQEAQVQPPIMQRQFQIQPGVAPAPAPTPINPVMPPARQLLPMPRESAPSSGCGQPCQPGA